MAAITICGDFGAQKNKVTVSTVFPSICHEVMGPGAMIFVFLILSFKQAFSLSSFFFFFQYSLFCFSFNGCNTFSHLSEDMNSIFQGSLLFPELTISFGENWSVFILVLFLLLFPRGLLLPACSYGLSIKD